MKNKFMPAQRSKRKFRSGTFWLLVSAILAVSLLVPNLSLASPASAIGEIVGRILFFLFFTPFILLLKVELLILPVVAQYNNFVNQAGVQTGWIAARDLVNMLFIVVLLVMAFGTILKIQAYGYRQMLRKLIIMAILVNFSRTIVGLVIDLFQVVMLTFVSAWSDVAAGNIFAALGLEGVAQFAEGTGADNFSAGLEVVGEIIVGYLLAGIMLIITCVVVIAFIIILVVRIVMLWILIVISPLAFLANTFPRGEGYFQRWVDMLTKELMIGPLLAFFLWLSFMIVGKGNIDQDFTNGAVIEGTGSNNPDAVKYGGIGATESGQWGNVLKFIVGIAMLTGALKVSSTFGSMAGGIGAKVAGGVKANIGKAYRKTVGRTAGNVAIGTGGLAAGALGRGLQRSGIAPLVSAGIGMQALQQAGRRRKEAGKLTTKFAEKFITDPAEKEKFYSGRPGGKYSEAKTQIDNGTTYSEKLSDSDNEDQAKAILQAVERLGDVASAVKLLATNAAAHSDRDGKNTAAEMAKDGINAFKKIDSRTLNSEGGKLVVDQISRFSAKEQQAFLGSMQEQDRTRWQTALNDRNTGQDRLVAKRGEVLSDDRQQQSQQALLIRQRQADGTEQEVINQQSQAFKYAAGNLSAVGALLQTSQFNPDHANNKTDADKNAARNRSEMLIRELAPQAAKNAKDEDLDRLRYSNLADQSAMQAVGGYLSSTKAIHFAENSRDEDMIRTMVQQQYHHGNNLEALTTNAATRRYVRAAEVGDVWQEQINELPEAERDMRQQQIARNNLQFASEAFKTTTQRDPDGNPIARAFENDQARQAFVRFINSLNVTQALKINKADLEMDGVFDNLSDALQNSLLVSGIGDRSRVRNPQTTGGTAANRPAEPQSRIVPPTQENMEAGRRQNQDQINRQRRP